MDLLDESKENVQPLKRGRNMSILSTALQAQTDSDIHHQLMKEREQFEILVRSYSGEDPIKPWYDYVQWVEQNFPKRGKEGNLKVLLENCLVEFKDCDQYSQDVRYIDLWTRYMAFSDNPLEMYKQIHARGIGAQCAIFYQCWAEEFELANDMKRADQVYIEGIKRNARPVEELKAAHNDFQVRVARNILGQNPLAYQEHPSSSEGRNALSTLRAQGRKRNMVDSSRVGNSVMRPTPGILRPQSNVLQLDKRNGTSQPKIMVYHDENAVFSDAIATTNVKPAINIKKEKPNKENVLHPSKWNEGKFTKKNSVLTSGLGHTPAVVRGPSFSVHADENVSTPQTHTDIVVSNVLKERKQIYEDEKRIPVAMFEPPDSSKVAMYPKKKVYSGGTELSLEELRAIIYMKRYKNDLEIKKESLEIPKTSQRDLSNSKGKLGEHCPSNISLLSETKFDHANAISKHNNEVLNEGNFHRSDIKKEPFQQREVGSQDIRLHSESEEELKNIPVALFEPPDSTKLSMYPKSKVYCNSTEYSLEELRADIYLKCLRAPSNVCVNSESRNNSVTCQRELQSNDCEPMISKSFNLDSCEKSLENLEHVGDANYFKADEAKIEKVGASEKKPSFEIFVEDKKEMNAKLKQNESSSDTEPNLKKFVAPLPPLSKELPFSGCLKVPKLLKERKAPNILFMDCTSTSDTKESDQSLTVNTKAVLNVIKDMWISPPRVLQPGKTSVISRPTPTNEINIKDSEPSVQKEVIPFSIFSDFVDSEQKNEGSSNATSENYKCDVAAGYVDAKVNSIGNDQMPFSDSVQNKENPQMWPGYRGVETPRNTFDIYADSFVEQPGIASYPVEIPLVQSPGMTAKQLAAMEGTENKENELQPKSKENAQNKETSKKKLCFPSSESAKGILTPSNDVYFEELEKQVPDMEMDQENAFSDETSCTEAFAKLLLSSTPMMQPELHNYLKYSSKDQKDDTEDNTMLLMNKCLLRQGVGAKTLPDVTSDHTNHPVASTNCENGVKSASQLSIIYELSENKRSRSLGESTKSSGVDTIHKNSKVSTSRIQIPELEEELEDIHVNFQLLCGESKETDVSSHDKGINLLSDNFREVYLKYANFPSEKHRNHCKRVYEQWNLNKPTDSWIEIDNTHYLCTKVRSEMSSSHEIQVMNMASKEYILIRTESLARVWDHYIKEEIRLRLKDSSMVNNFVPEKKAYIYNNAIVIISPMCEVMSLQDLLLKSYAKVDNVMSESQLLYLVCKILNIILHLHQCNIAHCNLSVNSFLVGNMTDGNYSLILTDYGKAVDNVLLPSSSVFNVSESTTFRKLNAVKVSAFQVDYIGLADLLHSVIFNKSLDVHKSHGKWRVSTPLPRNFKNIWSILIEDLLNSSYVDLLQYHNSLYQILGSDFDRRSLTPVNLLR